MVREYWIITEVVTKCPKCGREYHDKGDGVLRAASILCATPGCGFNGNIDV
jgi:hypothetical protein